MQPKKKINNQLDNFDDLVVGNPKNIEKNLRKLLPDAKALKNKSIYLQILSQIALAQAMQRKFILAHKTLNRAEKCLTDNYFVARARILLERGRIFHQSDNIKSALPFFLKSYRFSKQHKLEKHESNAAHMIAAVIKNVDQKIKWNKIAIDINNKSKDKKTREYSIIDYQVLGSNYIQAKKYRKAIVAYQRSKQLATQKGLEVIALGSQWGIARSLRALNKLDEALIIQLELLEKYNVLSKKGTLPIKLLRVVRGLVFEELTEIYIEKAKEFASAAYHDLSKDTWFVKLEPKRIGKMNRLRNS